jgi:hypothetical protein
MKVARLSAHFCYRSSQPQGHSATARITSMKNSNETTGNRTWDLPACSAVPQPTAPPHVNTVNTGLFVSPSGISDPCGTVAGMVTPKGSMATEGETLQASVLPYRCSICAPLVTRQMSNFGKFQDKDRLLFPVHAMFLHDCPPPPLAVKAASTPRRLVQRNLERLSIEMLLSAVSVLVVAQPSSEIPEGLMNHPVLFLCTNSFTL